MRKSLRPLRLRGFRQLAGAYTVNELGNWIGEIALAVLVYDQTGSPLATAGAVPRHAVRCRPSSGRRSSRGSR